MTKLTIAKKLVSAFTSDLLSLVGDQPHLTVDLKADEIGTGRAHLKAKSKAEFYGLLPVADMTDSEGKASGSFTEKDVEIATKAKWLENEKVRAENLVTRITKKS